MRDNKPSLDLSALESDYDIVADLSAPHDARTLLATRKHGGGKRRDDETGVVISVVIPPEGDEGNALSHLASDTGLLRATPHRRLVPVIEGRWIGDDAYAVITPRVMDPSLAAMLAKGEKFSNPRVAAILREVNALLGWAREMRIVHRAVVPERIFVEPQTDRLRISFAVAPVYRLEQVDDAASDARTVARLAMAMLAGTTDARVLDTKSLAELRPDLPERLAPATAALLDVKRAASPDEVAAYIAMIGMADPIFAGESEASRIRAEVLEEQRVEREKLASERAAFERDMAVEREKLAAERASLERAVAAERDALRLATEKERAELLAHRATLETQVAAQRAELERTAAADRAAIERLREEITRAGDLEIERKRMAALSDVDTLEGSVTESQFAPPAFITPPVQPLEKLVFDDATPVMAERDIAFVPERDETDDEVVAPVAAPAPMPSRRNWVVAAVLVAATAGAASWYVIENSRPTPPAPAPAVAAPAPDTPALAATPPAAPAAAVPLPAPGVIDSAAVRVPAPVDSAVAAAERRRARAARDSAAARAARAARAAQPTDPAFAIPSSRPDSAVRRDSTPP